MISDHIYTDILQFDHRQVTIKFLGVQIQAKLHDTPDIAPKDLQYEIRYEYDLQISYI